MKVFLLAAQLSSIYSIISNASNESEESGSISIFDSINNLFVGQTSEDHSFEATEDEWDELKEL